MSRETPGKHLIIDFSFPRQLTEFGTNHKARLITEERVIAVVT